jgi:predicted nuclease of predicted toxin-antitoxin system
MHKFVIDVNLPGGVAPFANESCIHVSEMDKRMPDNEVWNFAREHGYTIITKDSDFSNRILLVGPPPKVIHIRFGNLRLKDFIPLMTSLWPEIIEMHNDYKLVNVYKGWIEGIN